MFQNRRPTKRALDRWDASRQAFRARVASSFLCSQAESTPAQCPLSTGHFADRYPAENMRGLREPLGVLIQ